MVDAGTNHRPSRGVVVNSSAELDPEEVRPPFLVGWGALWLAIALNVSQVFLLDSSDGLREPTLLPIAAAGFLAELWLFGQAVRCLSPVIAYAAYGTTPAVVTILSVAFFGEELTLPKLAGVAVVTAGVVLLATETTGPPRANCVEMVTSASERHATHSLISTNHCRLRTTRSRTDYPPRGAEL